MKYLSDLTTKQWNIIKPIFKKEKRGKHFQTNGKRKLTNAVLYLNKTGCQWCQLPRNFPITRQFHRFINVLLKVVAEKILALLVEKVRV